MEAPLPGEMAVPSNPGDRLAVLIANSPAAFNLDALRSLESAENLEMYYREETPDFPLMSGMAPVKEDGTAEVALAPLLCPVSLRSLTNGTGVPLSQVQVRLEGVNARAQMLRSDGFRIVETEDSPPALSHPEMMQALLPGVSGEGTLHPEITLWCYPFDGEGPTSTRLILSALADGTPHEWTFPLPSVPRGGTANLNVAVRD